MRIIEGNNINEIIMAFVKPFLLKFQNVRQLTRELRLQMLLIDSFIPTEYQ